jgi:hypothetical protein
MKQVFLSLLLSVYFVKSWAQKEGLNKYVTPRLMIFSLSNNTINNNLFGNVSSVTERTWYAKLSKGKLVKYKFYFSVYYRYDSLGNELSKIEMDNEGWYKGDTLRSAHGYKYDSAGHIIEMYESIEPIANDTLFYAKTLYKYNGKGEVTEVSYYDKNLTLESNSVFKYDSLGNLISDEYFGRGTSKNESERTIFRYNNDKLTKIACYIPANILNYTITIKYDQGDNKIETFRGFKYRKDSYLKITRYDKFGNIVKQTKYNKEGKVIRSVKHQYHYDVRRNWINEYYYELKKGTLVTERNIEYYPPRLNIPK